MAFSEVSQARHSVGTLGDTELAVGVLPGWEAQKHKDAS